MLETLRMVVTLSKTSACAPLRLVLWVHSFSGHITCLTYCLFTLSMRNSLKPVVKVLHTTSNVRATANSWYVLPLFLGCWDQSNSNILSPQDQASKWKLRLERWTTCRTSRKCTLIAFSMLIYFFIPFRSNSALLTEVPRSDGSLRVQMKDMSMTNSGNCSSALGDS